MQENQELLNLALYVMALERVCHGSRDLSARLRAYTALEQAEHQLKRASRDNLLSRRAVMKAARMCRNYGERVGNVENLDTCADRLVDYAQKHLNLDRDSLDDIRMRVGIKWEIGKILG